MNLFQEIKQNYLLSNHAVKRIIAANVAVFLALALVNVFSFLFNSGVSTQSFTSYFTLPANLSAFAFKPWSLFTYMFLHSGFLHILFNMLWLHWMGGLLHEYLGNKRVYQSYFLGGIFGGVIYILAYNVFPAFNEAKQVAYALGASAGVVSEFNSILDYLPAGYQIWLIDEPRIRSRAADLIKINFFDFLKKILFIKNLNKFKNLNQY